MSVPRWRIRMALWILAATLSASPAAAQKYCDIIAKRTVPGGFGAQDGSRTAKEIIEDLVGTAGVENKFTLVSVPGLDEGAFAQVCSQKPYVLYDPQWIKSLKTNSDHDWPEAFVLAHELGHHLNQEFIDPGLNRRDIELAADRYASNLLARKNVALSNILAGIDKLREERSSDYPTRCERRVAAITSFNSAVTEMNRVFGLKLPVYEVCASCFAIDGTAGLYLTQTPTNRQIAVPTVASCGTDNRVKPDRPRVMNRDLTGMCVVSAQPGALLTWNNIGVCALIGR